MQNIQTQYWVSRSCVPGCWRPTSSCQAAPGCPGLASAVDRNWTQECTDRKLDQDRRQNN